MSTSKFETVAVIGGTGGLGAHIVNGLVEYKGFTVVVYTRPSGSNADKIKSLEAQGVRVVQVDSSDVAEFSAQLKRDKVQVLVSTVGAPGLSEQIKYIDAAKAAGVARFIPSEFGIDTENHDLGIPVVGGPKKAVKEHLEKSGLEWTYIYNGFFAEYVFSPFLGIDVENKRVTTLGEGEVPFSYTALPDIGRFTAAILANPEISRNKTVLVEGGKLTWNGAIALLEQVSGTKFEVVRTNVDDAIASLSGLEFYPKLVTQFQLSVARGKTALSHNHNKSYPEVKPITAKEYLETSIFKKN